MSISLTPAAVRQIRNSLAQRGHGIGLRLGVRKAGCTGFAYVVDYADQIDPDDEVFESEGIQVLVVREHLPLLQGTVVDYQRDGLNAAFKFVNPNVTAQCGCGESFTTNS